MTDQLTFLRILIDETRQESLDTNAGIMVLLNNIIAEINTMNGKINILAKVIEKMVNKINTFDTTIHDLKNLLDAQ